jgi:hypothetical protein
MATKLTSPALVGTASAFVLAVIDRPLFHR